MTIDMKQFEDYSWMSDRLQEVDDSLVTYDPNSDPFLQAQWYGVYRVRAMPIIDPKELLRSVGVHWNVIPGADGKATQFGCPKFTWGKYCPVCDAIDKAIGERRAKKDDFAGQDGKGGILCKRSFLLRVLLLDFEPGDNGSKKVPKFKDLPQVKIMQISPTIASDIRRKLEDHKDFGPRKILHPKEGCVLRIEKNATVQNYWKMDVVGVQAIPDEYLLTSDWAPIEGFLPKNTGEDITKLIEANKRGVHPLIVNHVLSIPSSPSVALPQGNKPTKEELKAKLDAIDV